MSGDPQIDVMLKLHDAAMGDDPAKAAAARLQKATVSLFVKWLRDEKRRGSKLTEMLPASVEIGAMLTFVVLRVHCKPESHGTAVAAATECFRELLTNALNDAPETPQ